MLSFIPSIGPSPNTKKFFFQLSVRGDELLSTPKIIIFPAKLLPKLTETSPSNTILQPL